MVLSLYVAIDKKAEVLAGNLDSITFISDSEYELKIPFAGIQYL
jgi:hypothetical protein